MIKLAKTSYIDGLIEEKRQNIKNREVLFRKLGESFFKHIAESSQEILANSSEDIVFLGNYRFKDYFEKVLSDDADNTSSADKEIVRALTEGKGDKGLTNLKGSLEHYLLSVGNCEVEPSLISNDYILYKQNTRYFAIKKKLFSEYHEARNPEKTSMVVTILFPIIVAFMLIMYATVCSAIGKPLIFQLDEKAIVNLAVYFSLLGLVSASYHTFKLNKGSDRVEIVEQMLEDAVKNKNRKK